ncbi:formimidoylglutamase [Staphylococcus simiae]|uniref:Formimidoylglutamase n=1 Tax=Staphylococcus simiae CCM 7213 = CCUG 51256 TaxID=911238 RepID=G5JHH1_9STAP|nr:formimidoylglutamase [Staphylococcus simiae]EHJ08358.1 formimidoylglutamase [Staphylococcus simiae CCM 7213 = CCUG 51256]PNZ14035.1 formimidoylglutamase [Staphylococcus simiae]SNV80046.1 Formiminoglutamase [Staphylococcus simiae]
MYKLGEPNLWTGRLDSETDRRQFRHFQTVKFEDLTQVTKSKQPNGVGMLGYAVDKGVELNKGRVGAKEGPNAIKQAFAGLPDLNQCETFVDYGNVEHTHEQLIDTQKEFAELASKSIVNHKQTFLLGGGHDIAYAQYLALRQVYPKQSIGVINIDAHFDTRDEEESTSGTSFRQILEDDDNTDYMVLGISQGGNTQSLFDYAKEKDIKYVFSDELLHHVSPPIKDMIERFIHDHDVIMLTICMDVVDSAFAPGVSAPAVLGLYPHIVFELAKRIVPSDKVTSISIAEMNPTYDTDNRTAKLIANLVHHFLK